jgi:hypothetical protein
MSEPVDNPCLDCGACCKSFRVSFYWAEGPGRGLPDHLTEQVTPHLACMKGTNTRRPHCAALGKGDAGPMACGVYQQRPSPCRELEIGDAKCRQARAVHGMPELPSLVDDSQKNVQWRNFPDRSMPSY